MKNYLKSRASQVTTWLGLASAAVTVYSTGGLVGLPELANLAISAGLIHLNDKETK